MADAEAESQADELRAEIVRIFVDNWVDPEIDLDWPGDLADALLKELPRLLRQAGWMPPETLDRVQDWAGRTGKLPEHHINRDVLNSHLVELAAILHGR